MLSAWPPEPGKPLVTPEGDTVGLAEPPGGDPLFGDPPARRTGTHDADPGDEDEGGIAWPAPPPARGGRS